MVGEKKMGGASRASGQGRPALSDQERAALRNQRENWTRTALPALRGCRSEIKLIRCKVGKFKEKVIMSLLHRKKGLPLEPSSAILECTNSKIDRKEQQ